MDYPDSLMGKIGSWPEEMLGVVDYVMSIMGDQEWHTGSEVGAGCTPDQAHSPIPVMTS